MQTIQFPPGPKDALTSVFAMRRDPVEFFTRLAREHGLSGLAYLLDIARLEAEMNSGRAVGPQPDKPA